MSLIVAIKANDRIYMGCDSQVSAGNSKSYFNNINSCKIWSIKDIALMGGVGYARDSQVVMTNDIFDELDLLKGTIDFRYMVNEGFEKLYDLLSDKRCVEIENGILSPCLRSSFVFAQDDRAYGIGPDGYIEEIDDFLLLGSGKEIAEGILLANTHKSPIERIEEAIRAASDRTCYVGGDIVVFSTVDDEDEEKNISVEQLEL